MKRVVEPTYGDPDRLLKQHKHALEDLHLDINLILATAALNGTADTLADLSYQDMRRVCWIIGKPYPDKFATFCRMRGFADVGPSSGMTPPGGLKLRISAEIVEDDD